MRHESGGLVSTLKPSERVQGVMLKKYNEWHLSVGTHSLAVFTAFFSPRQATRKPVHYAKIRTPCVDSQTSRRPLIPRTDPRSTCADPRFTCTDTHHAHNHISRAHPYITRRPVNHTHTRISRADAHLTRSFVHTTCADPHHAQTRVPRAQTRISRVD